MVASGASAITAAWTEVSSSTSHSTKATRCGSGNSSSAAASRAPSSPAIGVLFGIDRAPVVHRAQPFERLPAAERSALGDVSPALSAMPSRKVSNWRRPGISASRAGAL